MQLAFPNQISKRNQYYVFKYKTEPSWQNYWKMVDGKWIRWNQMGTEWSIEKVDKTESDLGVDYKGEYKSTFNKLN